MLGPGVRAAPAARAVSYGIDAGDLRAEGVELLPLGSRFSGRGRGDRAGGAGAPQRAERARRARGLPRGRRGAGAGRPGAGPLHRAPGAASRTTGHRRRARACSTTTPTIRPRCGPPSAPRARSRPRRAGGLLPAASLLAHAPARPRVRARAGARRPRGGARRVPRARARRGLPRASAGCSWPGPRRTPPRGRPRVVAARAGPTPSACSRDELGRATCS